MKRILVASMATVLALSLCACTDGMGKFGKAIDENKEEIVENVGKLQEQVDEMEKYAQGFVE